MSQQGDHSSIKLLLDNSGSDKGKWYGGLYEVLLQPARNNIKLLVEIGIGTLIPDAPSSMVGNASANYTPGGSLRAWRDFLPNAQIHGLDIASDTQFSDQTRITTHMCDSTNSQQTEFLLKQIKAAPDVIIDDGLHTKEAQIATLHNFFPVVIRKPQTDQSLEIDYSVKEINYSVKHQMITVHGPVSDLIAGAARVLGRLLGRRSGRQPPAKSVTFAF